MNWSPLFLSQNTNDTNRDVAFDRLKARFGTWEEVRDASQEDIIEAIRPAGLANQKAPRMQAILRQISEERGRVGPGLSCEGKTVIMPMPG